MMALMFFSLLLLGGLTLAIKSTHETRLKNSPKITVLGMSQALFMIAGIIYCYKQVGDYTVFYKNTQFLMPSIHLFFKKLTVALFCMFIQLGIIGITHEIIKCSIYLLSSNFLVNKKDNGYILKRVNKKDNEYILKRPLIKIAITLCQVFCVLVFLLAVYFIDSHFSTHVFIEKFYLHMFISSKLNWIFWICLYIVFAFLSEPYTTIRRGGSS